MPGAVPQTSSQAICAAILPWVNKIAAGGDWRGNPALVRGINAAGGKLVHPALQGMQLPEYGQARPGRPCLPRGGPPGAAGAASGRRPWDGPATPTGRTSHSDQSHGDSYTSTVFFRSHQQISP